MKGIWVIIPSVVVATIMFTFVILRSPVKNWTVYTCASIALVGFICWVVEYEKRIQALLEIKVATVQGVHTTFQNIAMADEMRVTRQQCERSHPPESRLVRILRDDYPL